MKFFESWNTRRSLVRTPLVLATLLTAVAWAAQGQIEHGPCEPLKKTSGSPPDAGSLCDTSCVTGVPCPGGCWDSSAPCTTYTWTSGFCKNTNPELGCVAYTVTRETEVCADCKCVGSWCQDKRAKVCDDAEYLDC